MPMFYFHLSNCDEYFRDNTGCDLPDIVVAHTRAKRLAHMVMMTSRLANTHEPDWRRWTVTVTDDPQGPMLIIPFGAFGIVPPRRFRCGVGSNPESRHVGALGDVH